MIRRVFILAVAGLAGCSKPSEPAGRPVPAAPKAAPVVPNASNDIDEIVPVILAEQLGVDRSKIEMNKPIGDLPLEADDLDLVEIVMEIEDHFDVTIPDAELEEITGEKQARMASRLTPSHLVTLVKRALGKAPAKAK